VCDEIVMIVCGNIFQRVGDVSMGPSFMYQLYTYLRLSYLFSIFQLNGVYRVSSSMGFLNAMRYTVYTHVLFTSLLTIYTVQHSIVTHSRYIIHLQLCVATRKVARKRLLARFALCMCQIG